MKKTIEIISPQKNQDLTRLSEIASQIFASHDYFKALARCKEEYFGNKVYDWSVAKIGVDGEQIATNWGVWCYQMRLGNASLKTAGIGAVLTHPDYRRRGLLLKTAQASLIDAKVAGYDISVLFGIPGFYHKLGYQRAWATDNYTIETKNVSCQNKIKFQKLPKKLAPAIFELYNLENAEITGTAVHPAFDLQPLSEDLFYWKDSQGVLNGYIKINKDGEGLLCKESAGDPAQIINVLGQIAAKKGCKTISLPSLPYASKLAQHLRSIDCDMKTLYRSNSGPMIRLINLKTTLQKICPVLSVQIQNSVYKDWCGKVALASDEESVTLEIKNGQVSLSNSDDSKYSLEAGQKLIQLIIGTEDPNQILKAEMIKGDQHFIEILKVLFPARRPQLGQGDHF